MNKFKKFMDDTIDIKFNENSAYWLKNIDFSPTFIEECLNKVEFDYNKDNRKKDEKVEKAQLPPFILTFFQIIFIKQIIPSPEEFLKMYFNVYFEEDEICKKKGIVKFNGEKYNIEGIKNRFLRSYPSIIRDFYFFNLIKKDEFFEKVYYSMQTDYFLGYDIVIKKNKCFGVSLFVKTRRSDSFKEKKYYRHSYNQYIEIKLPLKLEECKRIGNIYLPTNKHKEELKKLIEKELKYVK